MQIKFNNNYIIIICNDEESNMQYDKDLAQKYGSGWTSGRKRRHVMFQLRYVHTYANDTTQVNLNTSDNANTMRSLINEINTFKTYFLEK